MQKIFFLYILIIIFPLNVYADTISIDCPKNINANTEFTCTIKGNTNAKINALSSQVKLSSNLSFIGFIPANVWNGDGADGNIDLYTDEDQENTFDIGTLKLKTNDANPADISIVSTAFYDESDKEIVVPTNKIIINEAKPAENKPSQNTNNNNTNNNSNTNTNNNNTNNRNNTNNNNNNNNNTSNDNKTEDITSVYLTNIKIENYDLNFIREEEEYTLKINDETSLNITPVLEDKTSSYEISGNSNLKNGSKIRIKVTSTDGNIGTYLINLVKENKVVKSDYSKYKTIFIVVIAILVVINIIRIISNTKNDRDGA